MGGRVGSNSGFCEGGWKSGACVGSIVVQIIVVIIARFNFISWKYLKRNIARLVCLEGEKRGVFKQLLICKVKKCTPTFNVKGCSFLTLRIRLLFISFSLFYTLLLTAFQLFFPH